MKHNSVIAWLELNENQKVTTFVLVILENNFHLTQRPSLNNCLKFVLSEVCRLSYFMSSVMFRVMFHVL